MGKLRTTEGMAAFRADLEGKYEIDEFDALILPLGPDPGFAGDLVRDVYFVEMARSEAADDVADYPEESGPPLLVFRVTDEMRANFRGLARCDVVLVGGPSATYPHLDYHNEDSFAAHLAEFGGRLRSASASPAP